MNYKSCDSCKYDYAPCTEHPCKSCLRCSHWEISEELLAIGRRAGIKEALAVCKDVHKSAQADAIDLEPDDDDFEEAFLNGREIGAEACIDKVRELLEAYNASISCYGVTSAEAVELADNALEHYLAKREELLK